jgi:predicted AAA+ superfamily ATPase
MTVTSINDALALLETAFLVRRLAAWTGNLGKRFVKSPKLHLIDSGLACHLIGADARRLTEDPTLFGRNLETFVVGELQKQVSWSDPSVSLYHFREASGT